MKQRSDCVEECGGQIEKVRQIGTPRSRLENNIKMEHK
jgi:hypothetical protein